MIGMVGTFILGTAAIAVAIATGREYTRRPFSLVRFLVTLIVAWGAIVGAAILLLFGVCAVIVNS